MTLQRARLGSAGEDLAARWLENRGFVLLARRWRCRLGEIDIVGYDGDTLVFIEVKTRTSSLFGHPEETLRIGQRARIVRAALAFMRQKRVKGCDVRFDVMAVMGSEIRHIPGAFGLGGHIV